MTVYSGDHDVLVVVVSHIERRVGDLIAAAPIRRAA
jgi:hypothetical protein